MTARSARGLSTLAAPLDLVALLGSAFQGLSVVVGHTRSRLRAVTALGDVGPRAAAVAGVFRCGHGRTIQRAAVATPGHVRHNCGGVLTVRWLARCAVIAPSGSGGYHVSLRPTAAGGRATGDHRGAAGSNRRIRGEVLLCRWVDHVAPQVGGGAVAWSAGACKSVGLAFQGSNP